MGADDGRSAWRLNRVDWKVWLLVAVIAFLGAVYFS